MMNEMNYGWQMGYGWFFVIIASIVVISLIAIIMNQKRNHNRLKYTSPMEIIKERYAKGEISKDEYEEKRKAIL